VLLIRIITSRLYCVEWTQYSIRPKWSAICNRCFPGPTRVVVANGILIASAVFAGLTRWQTTLLVGNNSRAHSGEAKFCYLYGYKVFFLSHWSIYPILNQLDPLPHSHTVQFRRPRAYWWLWRGLCVCLFIVGGGAIGSARSSWWEKSCCFSGCIRWRHRKTVGSVESFVVIAAVDWVYSALH